MSFSILQPPRILFGRGEAARAPAIVARFGARVLIVHGANPARADWLVQALTMQGCTPFCVACPGEPLLPDLEAALDQARGFGPQVVVSLGGGAVIDLGKALAAMLPAPGGIMDHLEVVGRGLPLAAEPLPFVAVPTTSGTGAEVTKNAVIGLPDHGRKVSLRDDRMIARVAIVDPALTDHCPWPITLASGMDAVTQVIEPYLSCKATPYTDALTRPAISSGLTALRQLREAENPAARDALAWTSLCGGLALANSGLGAVHGLAGVIGGVTGAAHGAICGALLGPVLAVNRAESTGSAAERANEVCDMIAAILGGRRDDAPDTLITWAREAGLPGLTALGLTPDAYETTAEAALSSSSMKGNPVPLSVGHLIDCLTRAA